MSEPKLRNPWPERGPGRPRRTTPFVEMTFRLTEKQAEFLEYLATEMGWAPTGHAVAKLMIDSEIARLSEKWRDGEVVG